jgi:hypothetical protein
MVRLLSSCTGNTHIADVRTSKTGRRIGCNDMSERANAGDEAFQVLFFVKVAGPK